MKVYGVKYNFLEKTQKNLYNQKIQKRNENTTY